ncbi:MAG: Spy/CpxP family protein refolding chaperone [Candidatus Sabulitectum sp.]|nr:Spy/CpxP family protein refolding chaperone [Candidatus Sabulitectum sp.]
MKTRITITGMLAAVLLLAGTAVAQHGGMSGRSIGTRGMSEQSHASASASASGNFFQRMLPMMRILDLTDEQREAIGDIMEEARESIESIRGTEDAGSHREDFLELFSSTSLSVSEVEALLNKRVEVMEEANTVIAGALVNIHDVLTPEQLALVAEFDPGSMEMRMGENGGRGDHRPGTSMGVHPHR